MSEPAQAKVRKEETPKKKPSPLEPAQVLHQKIVAANPGRSVTVVVGREYSDESVKIETSNDGTAKVIGGIVLGLVAASSIFGVALAFDKRRRELKTNDTPITVTED